MVLRINRKTITTHQSVNLLIAGLFLLPIYIDLMGTLSGILGFSTKITTLVYYGVLWLLLVRAIPQIGKAIGAKEFVGLLLFALLAIVLCFVYPDNQNYIMPVSVSETFLFAPRTVITVVPYVLIGLAVNDTQTLSKTLHTGARVGVVCGTISYLAAMMGGQTIHYDDMNNAYALCIWVCVLITDYQEKDIYFLVLGCFSLLLAGTRGPLVCVVVAVTLRVLTAKEEPMKKLLKVFVGILIVLLVQSDAVLYLLELISEGFRRIGVTELRIIDYIRKGMLLDDSGRDIIADTVRQKIAENPLLGYGPGGDRHILMTNAYVHNLFLEMWVSYGVVVGTAILGWMGYWLGKGILGKDRALQTVSAALFCGVVIKLFLSSSYLYSKELFLLLGICMAGSKNRHKKEMID